MKKHNIIQLNLYLVLQMRPFNDMLTRVINRLTGKWRLKTWEWGSLLVYQEKLGQTLGLYCI